MPNQDDIGRRQAKQTHGKGDDVSKKSNLSKASNARREKIEGVPCSFAYLVPCPADAVSVPQARSGLRLGRPSVKLPGLGQAVLF